MKDLTERGERKLSERQIDLLRMIADQGGRLEAHFANVYFAPATVRALFRKGLIDSDDSIPAYWLILNDAGRAALTAKKTK